MKIYHLKTCDTCRKAIKALRAAGHELDLIDVRADGVSVQDLTAMEDVLGYEKLLNTRSTTWRALEDAKKQDMSAARALQLMSQYPTLIKRPVIVTADNMSVGWTKDVQAQWLSS